MRGWHGWNEGHNPLGLTTEEIAYGHLAPLALTAEVVAYDATPAATNVRHAANKSQKSILNSAITRTFTYGITDAGPPFEYNTRPACESSYDAYRPSWPMTRVAAISMISHPLRA